MRVATYQLSYGDYLRFRDLVMRHSGLYYPEAKRRDLEIGLLSALQDAPQHAADIDAYYDFLNVAKTADARAERERLINLLTIGETHFFRNNAHFDALTKHVLPSLIARKQAEALATGSNPPGTPQLRLWSAGCATGEEPYSLAILLHQMIPDIERWNILILATDINRDSLARAQEAIYSDWSFREARAAAMRPLYFKRRGKSYQLRDDIRRMVTFAYHNLTEDDFPAVHNNTISMDLIICRNVTIYFAPETSCRLAGRFYDALIEGGWLIVGHSEPSLTNFRKFKVSAFPKAVVYQKVDQSTLGFDDQVRSEPGANDSSNPVRSRPDQVGVAGWRNGNVKEARRSADGRSGILQMRSLSGKVERRKGEPESARQIASERPRTRPLPPRRTSPFSLQTPDGDNALAMMDAYERARLHLSQGHIHKTIQTLKEKLSEAPGFAPAYCLMARAYADLGQWEQAQDWCEHTIELDSLIPEVYYILAMVDEHGGRIEQAIANLKKAVYLDRDAPLPYFNLAMLYKKGGYFRQSQRALKNVVRILQQWPPEQIIPDSGHTSASALLDTAQQLLRQPENA